MSPEARQLAKQRKQETLDHLWSCYAKKRGDTALRDRLVEHYTPLVQQIAQRYIQRYRLREGAAAIGDALLLLLVKLVPKYDGSRDFRRWAMICIREKMRDRRRMEKRDLHQFREDPGSEDEWPEIEALMVRPKEPGSDARFAELVAAVSARDAAILWLRFYRHLSPRKIAYALDLGQAAVTKHIARAIGVLRKVARESA